MEATRDFCLYASFSQVTFKEVRNIQGQDPFVSQHESAVQLAWELEISWNAITF